MKRATADLRRAVAAAELAGAKVLGIRLAEPEPAPGPAKAPKRSKYGATPTVYRGIRYDSKAEAKRAEYLDSLAPAGLWYVRQPRFRLGCPENVYVADFLVIPGRGGIVYVEDVKGHPTSKFLHDVKLWRAYGQCDLHVISGGQLAQIIKPGEQS